MTSTRWLELESIYNNIKQYKNNWLNFLYTAAHNENIIKMSITSKLWVT